MPKIVTLPGDGIGPEVTAAAVAVLREVAPDVQVEEHAIGGGAYEAHGEPFPAVTRDALKDADAVLPGDSARQRDSENCSKLGVSWVKPNDANNSA